MDRARYTKVRTLPASTLGTILNRFTPDEEWVDWFNNRRLLEPIGNIPPSEADANFYAALETEDMAAQLT